MQLFYNPTLDKEAKEVRFDKKESGHIIKVLRKQIGDKLHITNGCGDLFIAKIIQDNPNRCIAQIVGNELVERKANPLHMVVAPTKRNERFEWFLEKATEIGVTEITPIICAHSERKAIKQHRFERVLQSAMKQSLQVYLPQLNNAIDFDDFVKTELPAEQKFIAHCEDGLKQLLKNQAKPHKKTIILIGPEGDFSSEEIELALEKGFVPISLGENRLRTETAALVACHTLALINQ